MSEQKSEQANIWGWVRWTFSWILWLWGIFTTILALHLCYMQYRALESVSHDYKDLGGDYKDCVEQYGTTVDQYAHCTSDLVQLTGMIKVEEQTIEAQKQSIALLKEVAGLQDEYTFQLERELKADNRLIELYKTQEAQCDQMATALDTCIQDSERLSAVSETQTKNLEACNDQLETAGVLANGQELGQLADDVLPVLSVYDLREAAYALGKRQTKCLTKIEDSALSARWAEE